MKSTHTYRVLFVVVLLLGSLVCHAADTLRMGIKHAPPFVMVEGDRVSGLSIKFWELINKDVRSIYEYEVYEDIGALLVGVENGEVDLSINPITVSEQRLENLDFSQPYFISQTTFVKRKESRFWSFLSSLFSWEFFSAVAILLMIVTIFGVLVWVFERKAKNDQFKKSYEGIADGFWWSAVTMTTVGYGDKAPISRGGRTVAFIWMFTSIILISGLTAGIASALTVRSINSTVKSLDDLSRFKTTTVANSSADEFLEHYQVKHQTAGSLSEAIAQLQDKKADVVVYDKPILSHQISEMDVEEELTIADKGFKTDYYSFSFPKNSPYLTKVNKALVGKLKSKEWEEMKSGLE